MNIAIDISPLSDNRLLSHRVRGTGFYLQNLKQALLQYYPENQYNFFDKTEDINKNSELIHYPYFEPFFITLPIIKKFKRIVTVHDLTPLVFPENFPSGIKGNLKWKIQKLNLLKSERILTDSFSSKKDISKFTGINEDKIDVAYLAAGEDFQLNANSHKLIAKYKLPEKFVLYVGDATWNKNLPRLINAANKIKAPLVMVGKTLTETNFERSNPWNQDLVVTQKLISENKNILALGFVPSEDLVALYNMATVFVMPSLYEGFGLPILEAMQSGCPVITTRNGSLPEVAGDAAFYIEAEDTDSIADGIKKVFEDNNLQKELSVKGLNHAKKFTWKQTATDTLKAYESVIKR